MVGVAALSITPSAEVLELGAALQARVEDVVADLRRRTLGAGVAPERSVDEVFEHAARVSTYAIGQWMSGEPAAVARKAGWAATRSFAELAANRSATLDEVTKRCLRWRDATADIIDDEARNSGFSDQATVEALTMLRRSFDVTLVRMCGAFERERAHIHQSLLSRQAELAFLATHDPLTGLANRALVMSNVEAALQRQRTAPDLTIAYIDVDRFKTVNDEHGHAVGDLVLVTVGQRIAALLRHADAVGRLGGDEFVAVVENDRPKDAEHIAERIVGAMREPIRLESGKSLLVTVSVGIASGQRASAEALVRDADQAMYDAKRAGGDSYRVATPVVGRSE
jgi:diguanylate cyclase (GGDEF)-like protein